MTEVNDKSVSPLAQRFAMIEPYRHLLDSSGHTWLKMKLSIMENASTDPEHSLIDIRYKDPDSQRDLDNIFGLGNTPFWAVEHLYRKGVNSDAIEDIVYGSVLKGTDAEGKAVYFDPMVKIIEQYAEEGELDLAFNLMVAWDLYHPLKGYLLSKLEDTDFIRSLFIKNKVATAMNIDNEFSDAVARRDYRTALKLAAHSGRENLHIKALKLTERVINQLWEPQTDDERILLMTAVAIQFAQLSPLLYPSTYNKRIPIVEYKI